MIAVTFNIRLLQPLLVTQPGSDDETGARSGNYIPGSVLRNALAAHYIKLRKPSDPAADSNCRSLFFNEATRFLNAYPLVNSQSAWPMPLSWYVTKKDNADFVAHKIDSIQVYDVALEPGQLDTLKDARLFARDGKFCAPNPVDKNSALIVDVTREVAIHIQRENRRRLETKTDTQVYTYQALSAGQVFSGAIVAPDAETANTLSDVLTALEISIGGSRTAGYGRVRFEDVAVRDPWRGYEWPGAGEDGELTIVTLLSDAIVRDPLTGQYCEDLMPVFSAPPQQSYRRARLVGGFNRKWGLPTSQAYAIQAGSVFVYRRDDISPQKLEQAVKEGIGERRCDGFGQIAVNWQRLTPLKLTEYQRTKPLPLDKLDDPEAKRIAQMIVDHAQRRALDQALIKAVVDYAGSARGSATRSSLSRVRVEARQAGFRKSDLSGLKRLLGDMKSGDRLKSAAKSLNEIRVRNEGLYDWLCKLVTDPVNGDRLVGLLGSNPTSNLAIAGVKPASLDSLAAEYVARFIEGLTHQLIKREKRIKEKEA